MKKTTLTLAIQLFTFFTFSQALSSDTLHWTEHKKLNWDDFKGESIDLPGMSGQTMVVMQANFKKAHLFLPTNTSVITVFDRKNSWTSNQDKTDQTLKYYQLTFDLYEIYARRLRKEFEHTKFGIDPNNVFQEKYNAALTALSDRHKLFMKDTKMGLNNNALDLWAEIVKNELKDLDTYKRLK